MGSSDFDKAREIVSGLANGHENNENGMVVTTTPSGRHVVLDELPTRIKIKMLQEKSEVAYLFRLYDDVLFKYMIEKAETQVLPTNMDVPFDRFLGILTGCATVDLSGVMMYINAKYMTWSVEKQRCLRDAMMERTYCSWLVYTDMFRDNWDHDIDGRNLIKISSTHMFLTLGLIWESYDDGLIDEQTMNRCVENFLGNNWTRRNCKQMMNKFNDDFSRPIYKRLLLTKGLPKG